MSKIKTTAIKSSCRPACQSFSVGRNTVFATLALTFAALNVFSQGRLILNNNAYLVIDNSAYVVLDNPSPLALTTLGTGGNIFSENEFDVIKWNVGATTGIYTIPWTTSTNLAKIPLAVNKTSAGVGAGSFILSTYETATDMNTGWPSDVTNMYSSTVGGDGSLYVVDRFWRIDANTFGTKPNVTLAFTYDDAANELGGTNTIVEASLQAQRFNTITGGWDNLLWGLGNPVPNTVTGVTVVPADFFMTWTLVDNNAPLPIELLSFNAKCETGKVLITWSTAMETNNDYFAVERSTDNVNYRQITTIKAAGNSNIRNNYSCYDNHPVSGTAYYRLKQADLDGNFTHTTTTAVANCGQTEIGVIIYPNPSFGNFNLNLTNLTVGEEVLIVLRNVLGQEVYSKLIIPGSSQYLSAIDPQQKLAAGMYMVIGSSKHQEYFQRKIIIK